jgi:predicted aldo/keto reductase-like oxidoreductase
MVKGLHHQKQWGMLVGARPADDCVACGRCETACTQHLDIIRRLNAIAAWEKQTPPQS